MRDSVIRHASYALAVAICCLAPFERLKPIISLPGQELTVVELALGLAIAVWTLAAATGRLRPRWRTDLTAPLILLVSVMTLSALMAPDFHGNALRFTGRFAVGLVLVLFVARLADTPGRFAGLLLAVVATGTVVATLGILEYGEVPAVLDWLSAFRVAPNYAGGHIRVSSTLQYPTIAAMYLEIVFAIGLGLLLQAIGSRRPVAMIWLFAGELIVGSCVILTLTRTAYVGLGLTVLFGAAGSYLRWGTDRRFRAVVVLGALLAVIGVGLVSLREESWLRLKTTDQRNWYQVVYQVPEHLTLTTGETTRIEVEITNAGVASWHPGGPVPFRLSYHWLTADRSGVADYEGIRTELPHPVGPGDAVRLSAEVRAPTRPGRYVLAWDMLQEHRFWFSREFAPSGYSIVDVVGDETARAASPTVSTPPRARFLLSRTQLWSMAIAMTRAYPWLGVGPDNFRLMYGPHFSLQVSDLTYHSHNMVLEFFVNTGVIGGALFLWLAARLARLLWRRWRTAGESAPLVLGVAAAVLVIFAHGLLDYFLEFTPTYVMIFGVFGLSAALPEERRSPQPGRGA